jgi:hypothetical protein
MNARHAVLLAVGLALGTEAPAAEGRFPRGLPGRPDFFPLAVWLQAPSNALRYRSIGINVYVGLWRGPTEEQLRQLEEADMRLIAAPTPRALQFKDRPTIVGWMHGDEPDNAQSRGRGQGYGPPVPPADIVARYDEIRRADPERPVFLNLGQGVAWDGYFGRGVRTNHPEDYPEYVKGCDIASFDIYPASHDRAEIAGNLWYVPQGVERLRRWTDGRKDVWCCIETTRINNEQRKPTGAEVRSEVWMALIHGARGIIYFAHEFKPRFVEAGLLADEEMARTVTEINREIRELAPVLNSPDPAGVVSVSSSNEQVPVRTMVKRYAGKLYLFAVAVRPGQTTAKFSLPLTGPARIEVLGEDRIIESGGAAWEDRFAGYEVHLYRIETRNGSQANP